MMDTTYHAIEAWRASARSEPCLRIILGRAAAAAILVDGGPCLARDQILEELGRLESSWTPTRKCSACEEMIERDRADSDLCWYCARDRADVGSAAS